jgi:NAD(P)-dependent dehydrogenase (short-subunit alcohol dehydrogenase family)
MSTNKSNGRNAVVVGAGGGLGAAFSEALAARPGIDCVFALSRTGQAARPGLRPLTTNVGDPESLALAVETVRQATPHIHLLIICIGILHDGHTGPEKALGQLQPSSFQRIMTLNALLPLQVLGAFAPLLRHGERSVAAALSAMVGSIGDNRLGGWYSYRMSKAALNMGLKTAAIELARGRSGAGRAASAGASGDAPEHPIVVAVHPGTTTTALSAPHLRGREARPPRDSARHVLDVLDRLTPADTGKFYNWDGRELPW